MKKDKYYKIVASQYFPLLSAYVCLIAYGIWGAHARYVCSALYLVCFGSICKNISEDLKRLVRLRPSCGALPAVANMLTFVSVTLSASAGTEILPHALVMSLCSMNTVGGRAELSSAGEALFFSLSVISCGAAGLATVMVTNDISQGACFVYSSLCAVSAARALSGEAMRTAPFSPVTR